MIIVRFRFDIPYVAQSEQLVRRVAKGTTESFPVERVRKMRLAVDMLLNNSKRKQIGPE